MPTISLVMPVYNAAGHLQQVLDPLIAERDAGNLLEIIAIDDGSTDDSAAICEAAGIPVLPSGGRLGPGACRNMGVAKAKGDVILLVDSDVVCHPGVPGRIADAFHQEPDVVAVFGSYDDKPGARSTISTYRNLLHHYVHQNGREEASTFWAGLGAIRRDAYLAAGGFDAELYAQPSIEDIELGYRLRAQGGRIRLVKDIQGTHLKRWTFGNMVHTDVFKRAIPWARLMSSRPEAAKDLNLSRAEQGKAILGCLFWLALGMGFFWRPAFGIAGGILLLAWFVNRGLFRVVYRRGGVLNMIAAVFLHQFYYLYCIAAWVWSKLEAIFRPAPAATSGANRNQPASEEVG